MKLALKDVKVIEYGEYICAPYAGKLLADMGAEVIKIEKPGVGDIARRREPFLDDIPGPDRSGLFLYLNTNKMSVTLNVEKPTGQEIFQKLIKDADVLIEDTAPGAMAKMGLGYKELKKINPSLVMTSITAFGQNGPWKDYKTSDLVNWQVIGAGYVTPRWAGTADQEPLRVLHTGSYMTATAAAVATMCALHHQRRTGHGQQVDISQMEALMGLVAEHMNWWPYEQISPTRTSIPEGAPRHFFQVKDGWVFLYADEPHHWERLVEIMGKPDWANIDMFKTGRSRGEYWDSLRPLIADWIKDKTKAEIFEAGKAKGVPLSRVNTMEDVLNNPQFQERGAFVEVSHPVAGKLTYPGGPYKFTASPWAIRSPAPMLGQHNLDIYVNRLGYTRKDLVKLYEVGII
ncbi:MAG: CoA transferase [Dehalococcoidales bacterium]|nr:CoA transferase [Dehalococcoidales bacterium]